MDEAQKQPAVFDTDQQQLGVVYAKALLAFGQDSNNVDQLVDELNSVAGVVNDLPELKSALESPRIASEAKSKMLDKAFGSKVDKGLLNFLKVIGNKGRYDCLGAIADSANKMKDEMSGRVQAMLISAAEVDDSVKDGIAERLSTKLGKKVSLQSEVDPSIIGGMVIRIGDTVYDGSVVNQLAQVRAKAVKRAADAIREKLERFATSG
ncbi:MAG: ATP synthase F1 subunit delta [Mariniblastus sp.]